MTVWKGARARRKTGRGGRVEVGRSGGITASRVRDGTVRNGAKDGGVGKAKQGQDERFAEANGEE